MGHVRLVTLIFGICSILLFNSCLWLVKTFGNITFEQMVWHLANLPSLAYVDTDYEIRAVKFIAFTLFLVASFIILIKYIDKIFLFIRNMLAETKSTSHLNKNIYSKLNYILIATSFIFLVVSIIFVQKNIDFVSHINSVDYGFIEANYHIPDKTQVSFENKKSLVIILAESLENSFAHPNLQKSYIPDLIQWRNNQQYNTNMRQVAGTGWTIAALTGWAFGLPLKLPSNINGNRYISRKGFLPHATSIFDIFQQHGYILTAIMACDKRFAGQEQLLSEHGNFRILDGRFFIDAGYELTKPKWDWNYSDEFIFERAFEEYQRLTSTKQPFILLIKTTSLHTPYGYCPPSKKVYNDFRDAINYCNTSIYNFLTSIKRDDSISIIVLGDHYFMGTPDFLFNIDRTIYNAFSNTPQIPQNKRNSPVSALDMAPTLLECAGAKWGSDQFGLGISLFSERPSLLEQYGEEEFNRLLNENSSFYATFY